MRPEELAAALDRLEAAPKKIRQALVLGALDCVLYNQEINRWEYEIICALAAALEIALPLAPFVPIEE